MRNQSLAAFTLRASLRISRGLALDDSAVPRKMRRLPITRFAPFKNAATTSSCSSRAKSLNR